jgi:hypothetical protein
MDNYDEKQKLIDICFEIAFFIANNKKLQEMESEFLADWVRRQLKLCGFPTIPTGISYGILTEKIICQ